MDIPKTNVLTWPVHLTVEFSKYKILTFVSKPKTLNDEKNEKKQKRVKLKAYYHVNYIDKRRD